MTSTTGENSSRRTIVRDTVPQIATPREPQSISSERSDPSLLDVIEDKNKGSAIIHRVYIVSTLAHQDLNEIGTYFKKYFKDMHNRMLNSAITGLLLIYPNHSVHVVESENACLVELMKMLKKDEKGRHGHLKQSRVLLVSHTINRLYRQYNYRIVDHLAHETWVPESTYDQMVLEVVIRLQELGHYITTNAKSSKMSFRTIMDTMHYRVPELLPEQGMIAYLSNVEAPAVMTVTDWINTFYGCDSFDTELDTDVVWPMTTTCYVAYSGRPTCTQTGIVHFEEPAGTGTPRSSVTTTG